MPDEFIGIDIAGLEPLKSKINALIDDLAAGRAAMEVAVYLQNVLKLYPPQRYVSRTEAYGAPFQSERQRKWFFWALHDGLIAIPYQRTQELAQGWKIIGSGTNLILANETPGAAFVQGDSSQQANMMTLIGWTPIDQVLEDRAERIGEIVIGRIDRMLK